MAIKHFFVIVISAYYCFYYFCVERNPQIHKKKTTQDREVTQPKVKYLYIHLNIVINISQNIKIKRIFCV